MNRVRPGVSVLGNGPAHASYNAIAEWRESIEAKRRQGKTQEQAVREVVAEQPSLHKAFIEAHNAEVGPSTFRGTTLS